MVKEAQIIQWRGTPGVGDAMQIINVALRWSFANRQKVILEIHWEHGPNFLYHPDDPETIIQRTDWIYKKYHQNERIDLVHVYNSDMFKYKFWDLNKVRVNFVNRDIEDTAERSGKTGAWYNPGWLFEAKEFKTAKPKKIVVFNSSKNAEPPRRWKRFVTDEEWNNLIKKMRDEWGYNVIELTYRHPIETAYRQIQNCDAVISYDGMWHWIARNFCKPMIIPSYEGITSYATPNALKAKDSKTFHDWLQSKEHFEKDTFPRMQERADELYNKTVKEIKYV